VTPPSIVFVAHFDDGLNAHSAQMARAMERLGADVTLFDLSKKPGLLGRLTGADLDKRLAKTIAEAEATLVLVSGGYELDESTVVLLRSVRKAVWVNWFPDDIGSIDQMTKVAPAYDHVFATGSDVARAMEDSLARTIPILPHAADPSVYRPVKSRDQYRANVVFAGDPTPAREAYLSGLVEFGLALWGPGWRQTSLRDYCRGEFRTTPEYAKAYAGATVAVNVHRDLPLVAADARAGCNKRVFELAALGVAQAVDERSDLARWFEPGRHLITYRTPEDLRAEAERLLHDPPRAEAIAAEARAEMLAKHTYMHRIRELLGQVGVEFPKTAANGRS